MTLRPGAPFMVASALAFAAMAGFVKLAGTRLPSQEIVLARALVALVLSLALLRRAGVAPWGRRRGLLLLRGAFGFLGLSCVFHAVTVLPLAEATVIQYLHPVFTAALAAGVLREAVAGRLGVSIALGLAGVVLVARPAALLAPLGGASVAGALALPPVGLAVAVAGAFFSACAYVVVRRLAAEEHPLVIVLYFPLVTVPATLPFVVDDFVMPVGREWLWLAAVGALAQVGQVCLTRGMQLETAARATSLSYLQVVFAAAIGIAVFGEVPGAATAAGAALILVGAFLAGRA